MRVDVNVPVAVRGLVGGPNVNVIVSPLTVPVSDWLLVRPTSGGKYDSRIVQVIVPDTLLPDWVNTRSMSLTSRPQGGVEFGS